MRRDDLHEPPYLGFGSRSFSTPSGKIYFGRSRLYSYSTIPLDIVGDLILDSMPEIDEAASLAKSGLAEGKA